MVEGAAPAGQPDPAAKRRRFKILSAKAWRKRTRTLLFWLARRTLVPAASALPRALRAEIRPPYKQRPEAGGAPPGPAVPLQLIEDALLTLALHGRALRPDGAGAGAGGSTPGRG